MAQNLSRDLAFGGGLNVCHHLADTTQNMHMMRPEAGPWNESLNKVLENQEHHAGAAPRGDVMATLTLEQIAEKARNHRVTPSERKAQRVSLIMGLRSKNSTLTRDEVSSFLDQNEGHETVEKKAG
jgi:hypothetical protein